MSTPVIIQFAELSAMTGKDMDQLIKMKANRGWGKVFHDLKISHRDFEARLKQKMEGTPNPFPTPGDVPVVGRKNRINQSH